MSTNTVYIGPTAVFRRFLAGLNVTQENVRDDESLWDWVPTQPYQLERMAAMLGLERKT
jgi:hypothetical protein